MIKFVYHLSPYYISHDYLHYFIRYSGLIFVSSHTKTFILLIKIKIILTYLLTYSMVQSPS